ncbi:MAG: COX15/CtaA family protein, partial [Saprospiraceae bacterium]|nr:COX15/CtaA family protein [Saprospiraceae bacterium]
MHRRYGKVVQWWLLAGVIMVFVQIVLGGITRLTGSGLSITKWEIVTGTLPPLNAGQWDEAFGLYKETPQYQKINEGMSMSEFKVIYFWEYLHRLWARSIGLVFIIPFVVFLFRRKLDRPMLRYLGKLVILGLVVAAFGWIMVASGLNDRPWVNAYKLTIHLNLGILLYAMVFWVFLYSRDPVPKVVSHNRLQRHLRVFTVVLIVQLLIGGIMSGMKAGLYYPTWPDMNGVLMPDVLLQPELWRVESFVQYDTLPLAPALVQFMHRMFAYAVLVLGL